MNCSLGEGSLNAFHMAKIFRAHRRPRVLNLFVKKRLKQSRYSGRCTKMEEWIRCLPVNFLDEFTITDIGNATFAALNFSSAPISYKIIKLDDLIIIYGVLIYL